MTFDLARISAGLPAATLLPRLHTLGGSGVRAVVQAPPGTGKTTVVPPALAEAAAGPGRIVVTQPRRMAAHAAAARLAHLSGLRVGEEVGFSVRGESKASGHTRVEFVTTGVLLRRLLRDPELAGVSGVILDEVHERSLDTDLAFGMLRELGELRDDLSLLAMSATLDAEAWARLLADSGGAGAAPVLRVDSVSHPLTVHWAPPARRPLDARGVRPDFLTHIARTAREAVQAEPGDVLVFAPGRREVERIADLLRTAADMEQEVEVLTLTGSTPAREQQRILAPREDGSGARRSGGTDTAGRGGRHPSGARRVIVATSVAESALTVPGVRIVVDSCLARVPHFDTGRGMGGLTTVRVAKASGEQRAGRAARQGPGTVWRCCAEADWAAFPGHAQPEVLTADLTSAALDLAVWGSPGGQGLALPTPLPERGLAAAARTLHGLGALEEPEPLARPTQLGRRLARVPVDPRTARGLLLSAPLMGAVAAGECAALLSADTRTDDGDLAQLLRQARGGRAPHGWARETKRLATTAERETAGAGHAASHGAGAGGGAGAGDGAGAGGGGGAGAGGGTHGVAAAARTSARASRTSVQTSRASALAFGTETTEEQLGLFLALSRPDLLARRRADGEEYLLASGTGAQLPRGSRLAGEEWIAVAEVGLAGERPLLRAGVGVHAELALWAGAALRTAREEATWSEDGVALRARRVESLGAIELSSTPVQVSESAARTALAERVGRSWAATAEGARAEAAWRDLAAPGEIESFELLRSRLGLLHRVLGAPWPDVRAEASAPTDADAPERAGRQLNRAGTAPEWLSAEIDRAARALAKGGKRAVRLQLHSALQGLLPWPEAVRLDELAPVRVEVPSGSQVRLQYAPPEKEEAPVLAVKLQEMFGAEAGPAVVQERIPVVLHLLSPAQRTLAVTADLAGFWTGAYAHVRAENRGRYPKHPWPEDPRTASATKLTKKRAGLQ